MKNYLSMSVLIANLLISTAIFTPLNALKITTYNIEHGDLPGMVTNEALFAKSGNWKKRAAGVCDVIKKENADIYCFQEPVEGQLEDIKKALPGYEYVGEPRGNYKQKYWHYVTMAAATNEYNPIFYNPKTVKLLNNSTFGIDTNTETHLAAVPRICTNAQFEDIQTGKRVAVYNTHLDNKNEFNRIEEIKVIFSDIKERYNNKLVIVTGDFNTTLTDNMEKTITEAGFTDARTTAKITEGPIATHIKKGHPVEIDHILIKPAQAFTIQNYKVTDSMGNTASDHNPVSMTFSVN